ncbi:MAG: hypothetical protein R3B95_19630 [Nitrospirales bacterium]|nr:hypothetical protein [Nitrospirales bacterium]
MGKNEFSELANKISEANDADILLFNGSLRKPADRKIIEDLCRKKCRKNLILILVTDGGSPDVAFKISRCLQDNYDKFSVFVTGICKSAGTLVAIGANEIIMSDFGELGPLDVQLQKADELMETSSGLTDLTALTALQSRAFNMFERYFLELKGRSGGRITLKTAMDVAGNIMVGLYGEIFSQIDPMRLGEISRAMNIGLEYGERLNKKGKNLKENALATLTGGYPSHGFVIDRCEAKDLFTNLREPTDNEMELALSLGDIAQEEQDERDIILFLSKDIPINHINDTIKNNEGNNGQKESKNTRRSHSQKGKTPRTSPENTTEKANTDRGQALPRTSVGPPNKSK